MTTDLALFQLIVPCGIHEFGVASLEALTGIRLEVADAARLALPEIAEGLGARVDELIDASELGSNQLLERARAVRRPG